MDILMITHNDPAGMGIAFTNAINRYTEHTCRLITSAEMYGFNYEKDIHLPDIEADDFGEIEQLLKDADIIHFHVLRDENSHLGPFVIRDYIKGKKILHHHHGHPDFIINANAYNEKYKKLNRKVIVSTPDLLKIAENSTWVPNLIPLKDSLFLPRYENTLPGDSIKVCQSPTRKFHKHTNVFKAVMSNLQNKLSNVEAVIIEKIPYHECLRIKRACHLIFDHMCGWFGISSLESLSQGKPVIAGLDDWNIKCIKEFTCTDHLPWIVARSERELERRIEEFVVDKLLRQSTGKDNRSFMEKNWTEQHVLNVLFQIYNSL